MKNVKKLIAIGLVVVMTMSLVACGGKKTGGKGSNGGKEVEIAYWHSGMGIDWLEEMVSAFNSSQSDWNVTFKESAIKETMAHLTTLQNTSKLVFLWTGMVKSRH